MCLPNTVLPHVVALVNRNLLGVHTTTDMVRCTRTRNIIVRAASSNYVDNSLSQFVSFM